MFSFTTEKAFVLNKIHDADGSVRWSAPVFMQGSSVGVGCSLGEEGRGRVVVGGWAEWVGGGRLPFWLWPLCRAGGCGIADACQACVRVGRSREPV